MSASCHSTPCDEQSEQLVLNREAKAWLRIGMAGLLAAQAMIVGLAVSMPPVEDNTHWMLHCALALSAVGLFLLAASPIRRESYSAFLSQP